MKTFSLNFKLQSVTSKTKPIVIVLNLNTRDSTGKYLNVSKSIGQSVLEKEWDIKRGLPSDLSLATQLISLKQDILFRMEEHRALTDDDLIKVAKAGYFQQLLSDTIEREFYGKFSDNAKLIADVKDHTLTNVVSERENIKNKIIDFNYKLVNEHGYLVDLDRFFSSLNFYPSEQQLNRVISIKPTAKLLPHQLVDNYPVAFWEYIGIVADKKVRNEQLNESGCTDYKQKLGARFKEWDEELTLGQLNDDMVAEFFLWLRENNDYSANYYANFKKWTKSVLNFAIDDDKKVLPLINTNSFIYEQNKEKVSFPYLTEEMLLELLKLEFEPKDKHLEYTRDLFYIASYTGGLTFGDLSQAFNIQTRKVDGHDVNYIRIARNKTGINSEIPLMDEVYKILKKYDFKFKKITNQYYNKNIQEICKLAGFVDDFIQVRMNIKTKKQEQIVTPFYKLIGSHSARRSFATNFYYHRNMPASLIMEFTCHKKLESFLTYVQASAKVKFDEFSKKVIISAREK